MLRCSKLFLLILVVSLLVSCSSANIQQSSSATEQANSVAVHKQPIKIGALHNMTGNEGPLDAPASQGSKLAVKQINEAGGILGRPIELILMDTKTDAATAGSAATQLVNDKIVAAIGYSDTDFALVAGPIFAQAKIPYVTSGATSPKLVDVVKDWLFMGSWADNTQAAAMAEYAYKTLNVSNVFIMNNSGKEVSYLVTGYFRARFVELGGKIVHEEPYQVGDKDYSASITKFKSFSPSPDAIFIGASPDDIGTIIKQFREAGIEVPILSNDGADTPLLLEVAGKYATNVYYTTHAFFEKDSGTEEVKKFMAAYSDEYGNIPENAFVGLAYDSMMLMADAIKRAGSTDPEMIRKALMDTKDFKAITGNISYDPPNRIPNKLVYIIGTKDQKFYLVDTVLPEKVPAP